MHVVTLIGENAVIANNTMILFVCQGIIVITFTKIAAM